LQLNGSQFFESFLVEVHQSTEGKGLFLMCWNWWLGAGWIGPAVGSELDLPQVSLEWALIGYIQFIMRSVLTLSKPIRERLGQV
jgi:hypothetical protein